jgi:hypothetical protein
MVAIRATSNVREFITHLNDVGRKHMPEATRRALNSVAFNVMRAQAAHMERAFDRPTPFTLRSVRYQKATRDDLNAAVFFRGRDPHYLIPQVEGGTRPAKRIEDRLRARNILLPSEYVVPARGYPTDRYGNLPRSLWNRILSQLQAQADPQQRETARSGARSRRRRTARYFVGGLEGRSPIGSRLPRGIYERRGGSIRGVVMFVRQPNYTAIYPFYELAAEQAEQEFPREFDYHLRRLMGGSRRNR